MTLPLPVAVYRYKNNRGNGKFDYDCHAPENEAHAYRDNCLEIDALCKVSDAEAAITALEQELQRAYRCIQAQHNALRAMQASFPSISYHSLSIGAAKRFVFEGALDGSEYFIGKPAQVLHEALKLGEES